MPTTKKSAVSLSSSTPGGGGLDNRIIIKQASDLSGILDSTKEYFVDGHIDVASQSAEVPIGGLNFGGYNVALSSLFSSVPGHKIFTSPVGGCGSLEIQNLSLTVSGSTSGVYELVGATGDESLTTYNVNYLGCESLGSIDNFNIGVENITARIGGKPQLELIGAWGGGYFITTSAVDALTDGTYSIFKAGAGFVMSGVFRTDQNINLPASASFCDFAPSNFVESSTFQLKGMVLNRNGVIDSSDSNITPNISRGDLVSYWKGNDGVLNTHVGGTNEITTRVLTTFTAADTFEDVNGTTTPIELQHFDSPVAGQLRHLGVTPVDYTIFASYRVAGPANEFLTLKVVKWDDSASGFVDVGNSLTSKVDNVLGSVDAAFFNMVATVTLEENDYIKLMVATADPVFDDVAAEEGSYLSIRERF